MIRNKRHIVFKPVAKWSGLFVPFFIRLAALKMLTIAKAILVLFALLSKKINLPKFPILLRNGFSIALVCCLLFLPQQKAFAQIGADETKAYLESDISKTTISKDTWKSATEGLDFKKKTRKKKKEPRERSRDRNRNRREPIFNPFDFSNGAADFFRLLFVLTAVAIVSFILFKIMGGKVVLSNKRVRQTTDFNIEELDEETIKETELDRFLREALANKDYRLAVRIYYLEVLKQLTLSRFIKFKKDKTNREYINEMRSSDHYNMFQEITLTFDRTWYGEKEINENDFSSISPKFQSFIKAVKI